MLERQKRLNEVYEYVHNHFSIHNKQDFADAAGYARAYISSALNGNKKYLTDKLFTKISEAFPKVFDLNYLLTGEGYLLTIEEQVKNEELSQSSSGIDIPSWADALIDTLSRSIVQVTELRHNINTELARTRELNTRLERTIDRLERLESTILTDRSSRVVGMAAEPDLT